MTDTDTGLGRPVVQSADPIDRVVRLAPTWTVCVLVACGLLVAGTVVWAFAGSVTTSVSTTALYHQAGASDVTVDKAGVVDTVLVELGDEVRNGQQLLRLQDGRMLVSPQNGAVTSVLVSAGLGLAPGDVAVRVTDLQQPDHVVALVPAALTGTVTVGLPVQMEVASAPSSKYGYLLGTVAEISSDPYTSEQIAAKLGLERQIVDTLLGTEPGLLAVVRLEYDADTPSTYRWSVGQGPPFVLTQGVPITARIVLTEQAPNRVVFG